jgi:phosphate transport system substrate-binding protein
MKAAVGDTRGVVLAFLLFASGCARPAELVRVDGSPGVAPLVSALVQAYRAESRDTVRVATGLGSTARLAAVADGTIDVAMASQGLVDADLRRRGLAAHEIARTAVVFAVDASIPVTGVTRQQACDVIAGSITRWGALGGPDRALAAMTRPPNEVDYEVASAGIGCFAAARPGPSVRVIERPDSMAAALSRTPGVIGLTSLTVVEQSGGRLRALALDGVAPTAANVTSGGYGLVRRAFLVTRAAAPPKVERFLRFVRGDGARVIRANGAVPAS